jgi:hypothetical protein
MSHFTTTGVRQSDRHSMDPAPSSDTITPSLPDPPISTRPNDNDSNNPTVPTPSILPPFLEPPPRPLDTIEDSDQDISYQQSNQSTDPPDSVNDPPFHHITSTQSNPSTQHLQNLLYTLSSRLDTIEINTTNRIDSIETKLVQSHQSFESQLLSSQQAITDFIKTTLSTNLHQQPPPSNPITSSTSPNLVQPTIPSHDPPTESTQVHVKPSKPNSPDPLDYTTTARHHYSTPSCPNYIPPPEPPKPPPRSPSPIEPPNYTASPPTHSPTQPKTIPTQHHHHVPHQHHPHHQQPMIIVQAPAHVPRLVIDSYKKANGYVHFKNMTLLNLSAA